MLSIPEVVLSALVALVGGLALLLWRANLDRITKLESKNDAEVSKLESTHAADILDVRAKSHAQAQYIQKHGEEIAVLREHKDTSQDDISQIRQDMRDGFKALGEKIDRYYEQSRRLSSGSMGRVDPRSEPR
jgi:hypothetical protein